jgi:hypothetical protein
MEVRSLTTNKPIYFAWEDYTKKTSAWQKLTNIQSLYQEKYGVSPHLAMLSPEDHEEITTTITAINDTYGGMELFSRSYVPRGVFRLALPE